LVYSLHAEILLTAKHLKLLCDYKKGYYFIIPWGVVWLAVSMCISSDLQLVCVLVVICS